MCSIFVVSMSIFNAFEHFQTKRCLWKTSLLGAIFSTGLLSFDGSFLYVATLGGHIYCLNAVIIRVINKKAIAFTPNMRN